MRDLPIACELTPAEMEARRQSLLAGLLAQAQERLALTNGFRWRFAPGSELLAGVVKAIDLERQCCRFLHFVLTVEPDAGPIWLEVTGPQGTAEFLEALSRNGTLSFGALEPNVHYTERHAAYIVIVADSKVAMVKPGQRHFLPGGGSFAGEAPEATVIREVAEELARSVRLTRRIGEVIQYFYSTTDERHYKMLATFFAGEFIDESTSNSSGKSAENGGREHELVWLLLTEADELCFHACHAWAIRQASLGPQLH